MSSTGTIIQLIDTAITAISRMEKPSDGSLNLAHAIDHLREAANCMTSEDERRRPVDAGFVEPSRPAEPAPASFTRPDTETIDKLFLELSQFTTAKTNRELQLEAELNDRLEADGERCAKLCMATGNVRNASKKALELCYQIERCGASTELTQASIMASALSAELNAMLSDLQRDAYQSASAKPQPPLGRMSVKDAMSTMAIAVPLYETYCKSVGGKAFNGDPLPTWREFHADTTKQKQVNAWLNVAIEAAYQFGLTTRPAEPVTARYSRPGDAGPG